MPRPPHQARAPLRTSRSVYRVSEPSCLCITGFFTSLLMNPFRRTTKTISILTQRPFPRKFSSNAAKNWQRGITNLSREKKNSLRVHEARLEWKRAPQRSSGFCFSRVRNSAFLPGKYLKYLLICRDAVPKVYCSSTWKRHEPGGVYFRSLLMAGLAKFASRQHCTKR